MQRLLGRRYENGEPVCVTVASEKIESVVPVWPAGSVADWPWIAPAMFDLQINGYGGIWFGKVGIMADEVLRTLEPHFRYGTTRICPTLITNSFENLAGGFAAIDEACRRERWADLMVPGCHLEGPYISREDGPRGAHPLEHVRPADWNEFEKLQAISGNRIRLVTVAADSPGAPEFIRRAVANGVTIAIGHTAATPEQIREAVDAGARLSTHLGNGAHGMIRRHPNYIWEQLGDPRLTASVISDGHHLPDSVLRSFVKVKGVGRTVITCDAAGLAGCPPGVYKEGSMEVEILPEGKIVLAGQNQLLAGSAQETDVCVTHMMKATGVSLKDALDMAGKNPARLLGFDEIRLRRGSRADLILFRCDDQDGALKIDCTLQAGVVRHGSVPELLKQPRSA